MKKNYITKAFMEAYRNKAEKTGVYYNTPKVIYKGDKYRTHLSLLQKAIYQELWNLVGKAAHKNQVDEKGRVYVIASYNLIATELDITERTIINNMSGKTEKYNQLFKLGLLQIKQYGKNKENEYYVMAPSYEGDDVQFLEFDQPTATARAELKEVSEQKRSKLKKSDKQQKNEQLEDEKAFDTKADNADYEVNERKVEENTPDFDGEEPKAIVEEPKDETYFQVIEKQDGTYKARFVREQNGMVTKWSLTEFVTKMKLNINCNRHDSVVMADIEALGKYEIKYEN